MGQDSAKPILRKLAGLRRQLRNWFLVDGLMRLAFTIVALVAVDFVIDRFFEMDRSQRLVMLVIMLGVVAYVAWRWLIKPILVRPSNDALLLEVEGQNELGGSLISAYQLAGMDPDQLSGASPALVEATIRDGFRQADEMTFGKVLKTGDYKRNIGLLAVGALLLLGIGYGAATWKPLSTWFNRNVLLGDAQWPQPYTLALTGVEDGTLVVPRGDDWPIVATVIEGTAPDALRLETRRGGKVRWEEMAREDEAFEGLLANVQDPFRFRVSGKKVKTPWYQIELVDRPAVDAIELLQKPPLYAALDEGPLPAGSGPYYVLKGTQIRVSGKANKPIRSAAIVVDGERFEMDVEEDSVFKGSLPADTLKEGVHTVELFDQTELTLPGNTDPTPLASKGDTQFTLRFEEDRKPIVKARLEGVGGMVVAGARLPFVCSVEDDYAITRAVLNADWEIQTNPNETNVILTATNGTNEVAPENANDILGDKRLAWDSALELPPMEIPEGARLSLQWVADDNDNITGPKSGQSERLFLRVVREVELRDDILRREKEVRQAFVQKMKQQENLIIDTQANKVDSRDAEELSERQRTAIYQSQRQQKMMSNALQGISKRLKGIRSELLNNRLETEDSSLVIRLSRDIISPIDRLSDERIPTVVQSMDDLRRIPEKEKRNEAFSTLQTDQKGIYDEMDKILKFMVKNEEFQLAVNLLYEIQKAQKEVRSLTEREKQRRIRELLDEKKDDPKAEPDEKPSKKSDKNGSSSKS